jgi:phosphatidylglycerophosphatase A
VIKERRSLSIWIATGLGSGYFPVAPGTAGSALGLVLVIAFRQTPLEPLWLGVCLAVLTGLLFFVGVWAAGKAEKVFGRVDPGQVVIDEVAGQILAFVATPRIGWRGLVAGFILFRAFDIIKPFPARRAERFSGGWGIMVDDLVAGLYSLIVLVILGRFIK